MKSEAQRRYEYVERREITSACVGQLGVSSLLVCVVRPAMIGRGVHTLEFQVMPNTEYDLAAQPNPILKAAQPNPILKVVR